MTCYPRSLATLPFFQFANEESCPFFQPAIPFPRLQRCEGEVSNHLYNVYLFNSSWHVVALESVASTIGVLSLWLFSRISQAKASSNSFHQVFCWQLSYILVSVQYLLGPSGHEKKKILQIYMYFTQTAMCDIISYTTTEIVDIATCNLTKTQFLMYVSLVHPSSRKKCFCFYGQGRSYWSNLQPNFPFPSGEHRWKRCTFGTEKNAREEKSSQCASHVFRDVFVLFVWGIFGAAGCCLYCISGQPTDMSPWDPKTISLDKLMIFLSTLSKVPGRHD